MFRRTTSPAAMACFPKVDPCVMRVQLPERARRTFDKGKKHKPEQIIGKLREADAMLAADKSIGQVTQALLISKQKYYRWRNQ